MDICPICYEIKKLPYSCTNEKCNQNICNECFDKWVIEGCHRHCPFCTKPYLVSYKQEQFIPVTTEPRKLTLRINSDCIILFGSVLCIIMLIFIISYICSLIFKGITMTFWEWAIFISFIFTLFYCGAVCFYSSNRNRQANLSSS